MKLVVQRGGHITARFDWVDFAVTNTDIWSTLRPGPMSLQRISPGVYAGRVFGVRVHVEQLAHERSSRRGQLKILTDIRLPLGLGKTYTVAVETYCAVDEHTTSWDLGLIMETSGLMALYARLLRDQIDDLLNSIYTDIHASAVMLEANAPGLASLLNEEQLKRVDEERKRLQLAERNSASPEPKLEGAVRISRVNDSIVVAAEALMPDRHLLTARRQFSVQSDGLAALQAQARQLAHINNPAEVVRGASSAFLPNVEFRQAAFEFGHKLYQQYLSGELAAVIPVLLENRSQTLLRLEVGETVEELPWEALHDGEEFVALKVRFGRTVGTMGAPSRDASRNRPRGILLVGSDSRGDLPGVETEVRNIGSILSDAGVERVEVLSGSQAGRRRVIELLTSGNFNVFHFSGHSAFDAAHPYQSYLELGQGTRLFLHELAYLTKARDGGPLGLAFLNSCESGRVGHDQTAGRNLSLSRALREAGVSCVIGMLWNVADDAAAQLGSVFYRLLMTGQGLSPDEAMRQTRRRVAMDRSWADGSWLAPVLYL
jgi:CHAT domain-containing protein